MTVVIAREELQRAQPLLSLGLLSSLVPSLGREIQRAREWPAREQGEHVAEVGPGLDPVQLTAPSNPCSEDVRQVTVVIARIAIVITEIATVITGILPRLRN